MAGVLLLTILSILIMVLGNTRYLAVPAVALSNVEDSMQPVVQSRSVLDTSDRQYRVGEGDGHGVPLRVMTYNIHYGTGVSGELNLEKIAATIKAVDADIIGLQEVDSNYGRRSDFQDQPTLLANYLGMHYVYGESLRVQHLMPPRGSGYYGNMILSRYPIIESHILRLPTPWGTEPRTALMATIATPHGQVVVWSTHLGLSYRARLEQVRTLLARVEGEERPCIVLGDFNALPDSAELRLMADHMLDTARLHGDDRGTFYAGPSQKMPRIDYIWLNDQFDVTSHTVVQSPASDHLAVVTDIVVLSRGNR